MTAYRLHYFPESGNSYKLALMLTLCGQSFERVWTDFGGGVTRTPEWRGTVNALGEIPVLEVDGARLTQTAPILISLARRYSQFQPANEQEEYEVLRWLFWDNHKLTGYMATYRYNRTFLPNADANVLAFMRKRIDDYLSIVEQHMRSHDFVIGGRPTIADISMMAYLSYPSSEHGYEFASSHPAVHRWLGRMADIPGWQSPYELLPGKRLVPYV